MDAKDVHVDMPVHKSRVKMCGDVIVVVDCFFQSDVEFSLVHVEMKEVQVEDEDVSENVKDTLTFWAIVDVDDEV